MALFPTPQESTFWFDFESLTDTNLWADRGPHGLHAAPQAGFTAPAYGLARTSRGKGYATFTGAANCYATLPLRFYDVAPTGVHTWVVAGNQNTVSGTAAAFSCYRTAGGLYYGIIAAYDTALAPSTPSNARALIYCNCGDATIRYASEFAAATLYGRPHVYVACSDTVAKIWNNRNQVATTWAGGYAAPVYDAATVPTIGSNPLGGGVLTGALYFLALFPFVFSHQQAQAMSDWLRNSGM